MFMHEYGNSLWVILLCYESRMYRPLPHHILGLGPYARIYKDRTELMLKTIFGIYQCNTYSFKFNTATQT